MTEPMFHAFPSTLTEQEGPWSHAVIHQTAESLWSRIVFVALEMEITNRIGEATGLLDDEVGDLFWEL